MTRSLFRRWALLALPALPFSGASAVAAPAPYAPDRLPGNGLAEHPFFYLGEWNYPSPVQTMFIVREGRVVWSYSIPNKEPSGESTELSDGTLLSNGNVLFARKTGAALVSPAKTILWNYDAPPGTEVHVAQPLGVDRALIVQNGNPAKALIVALPTGRIEREVILPTGHPENKHLQFRRVRMTAAGTLLAAHLDNNLVAEYDLNGKQLWSVKVPKPWAAVRLPNGNTLVTSNLRFAREYTPQGTIAWELTQADVPEYRLFNLDEANRLANGNTVISSWCVNGIKDPKQWRGSVQILEVTPARKVVWALRSWDEPAALGPASVIQLLDEPGLPEQPGAQQR